MLSMFKTCKSSKFLFSFVTSKIVHINIDVQKVLLNTLSGGNFTLPPGVNFTYRGGKFPHYQLKQISIFSIAKVLMLH